MKHEHYVSDSNVLLLLKIRKQDEEPEMSDTLLFVLGVLSIACFSLLNTSFANYMSDKSLNFNYFASLVFTGSVLFQVCVSVSRALCYIDMFIGAKSAYSAFVS